MINRTKRHFPRDVTKQPHEPVEYQTGAWSSNWNPPRGNTSCISGQQGFVDEELPGDAKDAVPDSPPVLSNGNVLLDASKMWDISSAMLVFWIPWYRACFEETQEFSSHGLPHQQACESENRTELTWDVVTTLGHAWWEILCKCGLIRDGKR